VGQLAVKNIAWLKSYEPTGKLAEALQSITDAHNSLLVQVNGSVTIPAPPSQVSALSVLSADGIFDFQIQDNSPVNRGVFYHIEGSLNPSFTLPVSIYTGPGRNFRTTLGNQTYYFRVFSQYLTSEPSAPVYFGSGPIPTAVVGGGSISGPPVQGSAGSGTGPSSGQSGTPQGFGKQPTRTNPRFPLSA
jgi:hypothetical protein